MSEENWKIAGYDRNAAVVLAKSGLNPLLAVVLASRGVTAADEAAGLLDPDAIREEDPFLLTDMDRACARVNDAISRGEHTAVYGDYDADGITAASLVADYLRSRGLRCDIYIPDRLTEGYGVNRHGIDALAQQGATLMITVDCGITACEEVAYAREKGVDVVVTDHHECGTVLPDAAAVVDPKRPDCPAGKGLAGVGVAYKLVSALERGKQPGALDRFADLIAVGTIADVMPVLGENRYLIRKGLASLRAGTRPGFHALSRAAGINLEKLNATSVGFGLAPRLNAAGRLGRTETALKLVLAEDPAEAEKLAAALCAYNRERQEIEAKMFEDAEALLQQTPPDGMPIVLASDRWHQGIAGIVASRLTEKYQLPAVMICLSDGVGRGSCRSVEGFSLYGALETCAPLLLGFGGHEMAAGLTIRAENVDDFRDALAACYRESGAAGRGQTLRVDFEMVKPRLLTVENVSCLPRLEPYGNENPTPVLCVRGAHIDGVQPLSGGKHTRFRASCLGESYDCISFSRSAETLGVYNGATADIAFTPQINEFRGRTSVQLLTADVAVKPDEKE